MIAVPSGTFSANGTQQIPSQFLSQIPSIAFSVPDLDGDATLKLTSDSGQELGCVQSGVTNGKTLHIPAVSYIAVGIAGAALALTGLSALGSAGTVGGHPPSLGFTTIFSWFQSMAMNGMHSVNYPPVYRSFSKNFAFSGGLIPWNQMQTSIDNFRSVTGGNLTEDSVQYLQNTTLAFTDGSSNTTSFTKRSFNVPNGIITLASRDVSTGVNDTSSSNGTESTVTHLVHGIGGYVEQLTIPQANTFMYVYFKVFDMISHHLTGLCSSFSPSSLLQLPSAFFSSKSYSRHGLCSVLFPRGSPAFGKGIGEP